MTNEEYITTFRQEVIFSVPLNGETIFVAVEYGLMMQEVYSNYIVYDHKPRARHAYQGAFDTPEEAIAIAMGYVSQCEFTKAKVK